MAATIRSTRLRTIRTTAADHAHGGGGHAEVLRGRVVREALDRGETVDLAALDGERALRQDARHGSLVAGEAPFHVQDRARVGQRGLGVQFLGRDGGGDGGTRQAASSATRFSRACGVSGTTSIGTKRPDFFAAPSFSRVIFSMSGPTTRRMA